MAGLFYFIPNVQQLPSQKTDLLPSPLQTILDGASWTCHRVNNKGPEDQAGAMLFVHAAPGTGGKEAQIMGYHPGRQTWTKVESDPPYWVGYDNGDPPRPKDLQRQTMLDGYPVQLKGQQWIVPIVHTRFLTLPRIMRMTGGGPVFEVDPRYEELMGRAEGVFAATIGAYKTDGTVRDDAPPLNDEDAVKFVADVLCLNYRMHAWELSLMNLITVTDLWTVCFTALGGAAITEEAEARQDPLGDTQSGT